ncbi:hypothetical protein RhiirB3_401830 [Rhizophagus irregularis]|uniref:MATA-HMG n=1 Tax=Rhizophagus irregularis TaxID=588596 RepID=A0A1B1EVA7_9GLOM|nr:MATA-HMG [Rhizophagus irregularis]PKY15598.1 hypothetical protein RhiirB3_401830 [Rhizophagus irregularis]
MAPTINSEVESEKFQIVLEGCDGKLAEKSLVQPKKRQPLDIPDIHLPFPPMITASEIFEKTLVRKLSKHEGSARKSPNKFEIYRTVVVLELHRQNIHYSMTEISGAIAKKWREEPKNVKDAYTKLASQVEELNKKHFGEFSRRKANRKHNVKSSSLGDNHHHNHHHIISSNYFNDPMSNNLIPKIDPISMSCNNNYNSNMYSPYIPHTICPPYYLHPQQQSIYHDSSNYHPFKQESYDTVDSNSFLIPI